MDVQGEPDAPAPIEPAPPAADPAAAPEAAPRRRSGRSRAQPAGKRRGVEAADAEAVRAPHEQAAQVRANGAFVLYAVVVAVLAGLGANIHPAGFVVAAGLALAGWSHVMSIVARGRLAGARALLEAERFEAAIPALKQLHESSAADESTYLVGVAYDRQGARRLALESFRQYLKRHKRGVWAVEARVRVEELEAAPSPRVEALARELGLDVTCPYCKAAVAGADVTVECSGCGTPHHIACYEEGAGCAVYGCGSKAARPREQVK